MHFPIIRSQYDMAALVEQFGFLPFTSCGIPGFSVAECTDPSLWFADGVDGPWEWKGPVIELTGCAYGKLFGGRMAFISREWYADLANWRRGGDDFDIRFDEGRASLAEKRIMDVLESVPSATSKELKYLAGFEKTSRFDSTISRLQAQGYVTIVDFDYEYDILGQRCSWGISRFATSEKHFGEAFTEEMYRRSPEESHERIVKHLTKLVGEAHLKQILKLVK